MGRFQLDILCMDRLHNTHCWTAATFLLTNKHRSYLTRSETHWYRVANKDFTAIYSWSPVLRQVRRDNATLCRIVANRWQNVLGIRSDIYSVNPILLPAGFACSVVVLVIYSYVVCWLRNWAKKFVRCICNVNLWHVKI